MAIPDVLALDFGATNSYYCKCPGDQLSPKGIDFGDARDGLATAILYRAGKKSLIGYTAIEEYGDATPQQRRDYRFCTHFKPDIAVSVEARRHAEDFLTAVLDEARSLRLDLEPQGRQVIFGVPSEAGDDFRSALAQIAQSAQYGAIEMLDEPKAALLYHLFHRDLPVRDGLKGLLVVDFGGGTCDFAFIRRGAVGHSWGDMQLGGRLFDDLFFQWLLDSNPGLLDTLQSEGSEFFVHACLCRDTKEFFSRTMARDREETIGKALRQYGKIPDMTWTQFVARARAYQPSDTFTRHLTDVSASGGALAGNESLDLFAWFRRCLRQGLADGGIDDKEIQFVILCGGSSQWPFVTDILLDELPLDESRIMRSDRPYATIAEGLAIMPALQRRFQITQHELRAELPRFMRQRLTPLIQRHIDTTAAGIAAAVTVVLFDKQLAPLLRKFERTAGSIAELKQQIATTASAFAPQLEDIVRHHMDELTEGLPGQVRELLSSWFHEHALAGPEETLTVEPVEAVSAADLNLDVRAFYGAIIDVIRVATAGIITAVTAMVCGGGGMALITSGPLGLIVGGVIGLAAAFLTLSMGAEKAQQMAEEWRLPRWLLKRVLTDRKIAGVRAKLLDNLQAVVSEKLQAAQDALADRARNQAQAEIDALSEINQF